MNSDNEEIDIPIMEDVQLPLIRHDPIPLEEDVLDNQDASLPDNELAMVEDIDCTQRSLGSMGHHDDAEYSDDDLQVLSQFDILAFPKFHRLVFDRVLNSSIRSKTCLLSRLGTRR